MNISRKMKILRKNEKKRKWNFNKKNEILTNTNENFKKKWIFLAFFETLSLFLKDLNQVCVVAILNSGRISKDFGGLK